MKYQRVLFASLKLHNIKESPLLPQEPQILEYFTQAVLSVFHLSIAQKANSSNDSRYKTEKPLPKKRKKKEINN